MEVRILHKFHDRADFTKVYPVGETFTFDDARANHLIKRGLVAVVPAEEPLEDETSSVKDETPVVEESVEEAVEESEETLGTPVVEEKAIKPVATKRRSTSKDN